MFATFARATCSEGEILLMFSRLCPRLSVDLEFGLGSCWQTGCRKMESIDSTPILVCSPVSHALVAPDY